MVNNHEFIIHKANHKKGRRHNYDIYKENRPATPKQVAAVADLRYLGIEKDFPTQLSSLPNRKKRNLGFVTRRDINITKIILKKEL
jgi:hypothetical protein